MVEHRVPALRRDGSIPCAALPALRVLIVRRWRPLVQFTLCLAVGGGIVWSASTSNRGRLGLLAGLALGAVGACWETARQRDGNPAPAPTSDSRRRGTAWAVGVLVLAAMLPQGPAFRWLVWLAHPSSRAADPYEGYGLRPIVLDGRLVASVRPEAIYVGPRALEWYSNGTTPMPPGAHPVPWLFDRDGDVALRVRVVGNPARLQVIDRDRTWAEFDLVTGELRALVRGCWLDRLLLAGCLAVAAVIGRRVMLHRAPCTVVGLFVGAAVGAVGLYAVAYLGA